MVEQPVTKRGRRNTRSTSSSRDVSADRFLESYLSSSPVVPEYSLLRDLISDSSDSLSEVKLVANKGNLGGSRIKLEILVKADTTNRTISVRDSGIGSSKEELTKKFGAPGSVSAWVTQHLNNDSTFVPNVVKVISRRFDDSEPNQWESNSTGDITIANFTSSSDSSDDEFSNPPRRGTEVILQISEDALENFDEARLRLLVEQMKGYTMFPISLWVPNVQDDSGGAWEEFRTSQPIWLILPSFVKDWQYKNYCQFLSKEFSDDNPICWSNPSSEGGAAYRGILYVPKIPATDSDGIRLCCRGIFLYEVPNLLPDYLGFVRGVVDLDVLPLDLPLLNLHTNSLFATLKTDLAEDAHRMIMKIADGEVSGPRGGRGAPRPPNTKNLYHTLWEVYGGLIKDAIIKCSGNLKKPAELLQFESSKEDFVPLKKYAARNNKVLYVSANVFQNRQISKSILNTVLNNDEVIVLKDKNDELVMGKLAQDFTSIEFIDVAIQRTRFADELDREILRSWWVEALKSEVVAIKFEEEAGILGPGVFHRHGELNQYVVNLNDPTVQKINGAIFAEPENESIKVSALLLYQTALLESGMSVINYKDMASNIYRCLRTNLKVADAEVAPGPSTT